MGLSLGLRKLLFVSAVLCVSASATAATKHVNTGNIFFTDVSSNTSNPAITTINVGDTVEWDWVNGTYTVASGTCAGSSCSPDGLWDSGEFLFPHTFSRTFNAPGTFTYYCKPHLVEMQGTVIVINPADFTVAVSDSSGGNVGGLIFPRQQTVFEGNVAASNGFNSVVSLSCQPGATALPSPCSPAPVSAAPDFSFTITAGAATPGHYSFAAQGTGGGLTHSFPNLNFDVVDFGIAAPSPASITAFSQSSSTISTSTTVTLTAVGSLPDLVTLACDKSTLPGGLMGSATCNFAPPGPFYNPTAGAPVTVTVSITVPAATAAHEYNWLLDATSDTNAGSVTKTQPITLHIVTFVAAAFVLSRL